MTGKRRGTRHNYKNTEFGIRTKLLLLIVIKLFFFIFNEKYV
jgi:hypothetical protein